MINGKRLQKLRKDKGLTQEALGNALGVSKSSICCYEKGNRTPSLENLIDLMYLFNVSADYLLGLDHGIKTISSNNEDKVVFLTKEEIEFIEELRKDNLVYEILFDNPKRGAEVIKNRIG